MLQLPPSPSGLAPPCGPPFLHPFPPPSCFPLPQISLPLAGGATMPSDNLRSAKALCAHCRHLTVLFVTLEPAVSAERTELVQ